MESLQERIAKRAYELFLARGGLHGYHIEDWAQAEREITTEQKKPSKNKEDKVKENIKPAEKVAKEEEKPAEKTAVEAPKQKRSRATTVSPAKKK